MSLCEKKSEAVLEEINTPSPHWPVRDALQLRFGMKTVCHQGPSFWDMNELAESHILPGAGSWQHGHTSITSKSWTARNKY